MNCLVYVWIQGEEFDPHLFDAALEKGLQGTVASRRRIISGDVEEYCAYWRSKMLQCSASDVDGVMLSLLNPLRDTIKNLADLDKLEVVAEISAEVDTIDEMRGFYFSKALMRVLSDVSGSIDIDFSQVLC